jgi:hypothetical protein
MITRFEMTHTSGDHPMTLIFLEGAFESLPYEIRLMAPWFGCGFGDIASLKPANREELRRHGYLVLREAASLLAAA